MSQSRIETNELTRVMKLSISSMDADMHALSQHVRREVKRVRSVQNETTSQLNVEIEMTNMCMLSTQLTPTLTQSAPFML